jgi:hypothetical protein
MNRPAPASAPRTKERTPSIWIGCDVVAWARLLARNGFAVHRSRWPVVALVTAAGVGNTVLRFAQQAVYGRAASCTSVRHAPVFVLGHWRSGTTLLHELLARDPRLAAPTTYECFAPHHFLLTRSWLPRLVRRLGPSRRPMDNMPAGLDRPQEDEFALALLGEPSPYERIAFPDRPTAGAGALDLRGLTPAARRRWGRVFVRLVRELTYAHGGRRLVLKSPPHTARIPVLLELFPDARFVHIVRDPYAVYPSTLHLWRVLSGVHGLRRSAWELLPDQVIETYLTLFERLEEGKRLVPPSRFHELRYEDLVRDPIGRLGAVYDELELGGFEPARPHVEAYLAGLGNYETNRYVLTPEERETVTRRWGPVFRRYGYETRVD